MSAKRGQRPNAPFTEKQEIRIILEYGGKSPDLSHLDCWFWSVAMSEIRRVPPIDLNDLKMTVETFAESLDVGEVEKCTRNIHKRARAGIVPNGGHFEF